MSITSRMRTTTALAFALAVVGCSSTVEDPLLSLEVHQAALSNAQDTPGSAEQATSGGQPIEQPEPLADSAQQMNAATAPPPSSRAPTLPRPPLSDETFREIAERWSATGSDCGIDSQKMDPEEVMASVSTELRAGAIHYALMTQSMEPTRVARLLELLAATGDPKASEYISEVYQSAEEFVDVLLAEALATDEDPEGILKFRNNMVTTIRADVLRSLRHVEGEVALKQLVSALDSSEPRLLQAAAISLSKRSDYSDRRRLETIRERLPRAMQGALALALTD